MENGRVRVKWHRGAQTHKTPHNAFHVHVEVRLRKSTTSCLHERISCNERNKKWRKCESWHKVSFLLPLIYSDMRQYFYTMESDSGIHEMLPNSWSNCSPLLSSVTQRSVHLWMCISSVVSNLSVTVNSMGSLLDCRSICSDISRDLYINFDWNISQIFNWSRLAQSRNVHHSAEFQRRSSGRRQI